MFEDFFIHVLGFVEGLAPTFIHHTTSGLQTIDTQLATATNFFSIDATLSGITPH